MKTNITFLCQVDSLAKSTAQKVADKLDLYYADVEDFLAFNLTSPKDEIINTCGIEYLQKLEKDSIKTVASFENSIISVAIKYFMVAESRHALKDSSMIVYLKCPRKAFDKYVLGLKDEPKKLELDNQKAVFDDYDKMCTRSSDIIIELKDFNEKGAYKKALKVINNYFK